MPGKGSLEKLFKLFQNVALVFGTRDSAIGVGILCVFFLVLCIYPVSVNLWMDHFFIDWSSRMAAPYRAPDPRIVIVAIDMETLSKTPHRWPWPRTEMIKLVNAISSFSPRMIVLDILFQQLESETGTIDDSNLAQTLEKLGNVGMTSIVQETRVPDGLELRQFFSHELFRQSACLSGFVWGVLDPDGFTRSCVFADDRIAQESCVVQVARKVQPSSVEGLGLEKGEVRRYFSFAGKNGGIPSISAQDLQQGNDSLREWLKEKIVFVGATAPVLHDFHQTSAGFIPGVNLMAATLDSILNQRTTDFHNSIPVRLLMALAGGIIGILLFLRESRFSLTWSALILIIFTGTGLLISEISGHRFPFGPTVFGWFFLSFILFSTRYLLNLMTINSMKAEAQAAGKLQSSLFPSKTWEGPNGFFCKGMCLPCKEVGGDYYDYFPQADGNLFFIIGDVTGHGFPAAMITAMAKTVCTFLNAWEMLSPTNALLTINQVLCKLMMRKKNMTAFIGLLNPETGMVTITSGGHPPAYHVDRNGAVSEIGRACLPLGYKESIPVFTLETCIKPGESLVLYTDGITEAVDWESNQYTFDTWKADLQRIMPGFAGNPEPERLLDNVRTHSRGRAFNDDVTLLILYRSPGAPSSNPAGQ